MSRLTHLLSNLPEINHDAERLPEPGDSANERQYITCVLSMGQWGRGQRLTNPDSANPAERLDGYFEDGDFICCRVRDGVIWEI